MLFQRLPSTEVLSEQTLNFARKSIHDCVSTCHPWELSGLTLARLLDIVECRSQSQTKLVHTLNMRYLWVDALCILQGKTDAVDWDIESQTIADIFRNAYIRIGGLPDREGE